MGEQKKRERKSLFDSFNLKLLGIVALIAIPIALFMVFMDNVKEDIVETKGNYFVARIVDKKKVGSSYKVELKLEYDFENTRTTIRTSEEIFGKYDEGDLVILKGKEGHWKSAILCDTIPFQSCFGQQPADGWVNIPACK